MFRIPFLLSCVALLLQGCAESASAPVTIKPGYCASEESLMASGIIGGTRVFETDLDSKKVMLLFSKKTGENAGICTATAIGPKVLLTAAHCARGSASNARVILYSSLSCESGFDARYNTVEIEEFIIHSGYKKSDPTADYNEDDIALIILKDPLPVSYAIHKIADPSQIDMGSGIQFLGYGALKITEEDSQAGNGSGMLRKILLPSENIAIHKNRKKVEINQSQGKGICQGDSGGPGFVKVHGESQILGVNSYVQGRVRPDCNYKSFLILAHSYVDWVQKRLKERNIYWSNK